MSQILLQYTFTYEKTDQKVKIICESSSDPCLGEFLAFPGFPGGSVVKSSPANARDTRDAGWIPGLGRCPGIENDNLLQYSCLKNPMDREAWWVIVYGLQKVRHD